MVKAQAGILESDRPERGARQSSRSRSASRRRRRTEREWLRNEPRAARRRRRRRRSVGGTRRSRSRHGGASSRRWRRRATARRWSSRTCTGRDRQLLEFVEHLVDWSTGVPLLVLCTARPELYERRVRLGRGQAELDDDLRCRLSAPEDTARLLSALLDARPCFPPRRRRCFSSRPAAIPSTRRSSCAC